MRLLHIFLALFALAPPPSAAKFQHAYGGIAFEAIQVCIAHSTFTPANITSKASCGLAFECVMRSIPDYSQSILSSGSAILGFIPTVQLVLGNPNEDIIRISARFPVLALFLSITNVNKISMRGTSLYAPRGGSFLLGPYGFIPRSISPPTATTTTTMTWARIIMISLAHFLAAAGAVTVIWQTVDLGKKAVMTWACWTNHYHVNWICFAVMHHLGAVFFLRLSLRVVSDDCYNLESNTTTGTIASSTRENSSSSSISSRSGLAVWNLLQSGRTVDVCRRRLIRWSKASADLLNNVDFLCGTAIFSSLTLVSGRNAMIVLTVYSTVAVLSRIVGVCVLEMMDDEHDGAGGEFEVASTFGTISKARTI